MTEFRMDAARPYARPYAEVIGDPVAHSKSPLIHGHWLEALGIDADYRAVHVRREELAAYVAARAADPLWRGCNVTMPHKEAVMALVDDPGDVRARIGAMNTLVRPREGVLFGTNTDSAGFFGPISDRDWGGAHVALVGTGGAARAILFALAQVGVGQVTLYARNALRGTGLLAGFGLKGRVVAIDAPMVAADLLVNASPLGMKGHDGYMPDLAPLPADAVVYDIVYAPLVTPLLAAARAQDLETVDGLEMLVGQAAVAFELFFGQPPPDDDALLRTKLLA